MSVETQIGQPTEEKRDETLEIDPELVAQISSIGQAKEIDRPYKFTAREIRLKKLELSKVSQKITAIEQRIELFRQELVQLRRNAVSGDDKAIVKIEELQYFYMLKKDYYLEKFGKIKSQLEQIEKQ